MHWSLLPDMNLFGLSHGESRVLVLTWIAVAIAIGALWLSFRRAAVVPTGMQNAIEWVHEAWGNLGTGMMGPKIGIYMPMILSVFLFVFLCNYMGMVPGLEAPTGNINTPLALALVVFVSFLTLAFWHQGPVGFVKHLMGPMPLLAPFMMPIEIVSMLARPFSLTLRLFANLTAGHMLATVGLSLLMSVSVFAGPLIVLWLCFESLITCWIQAAVFALLTMTYFSEAVVHAEESH